MKASSSAVVARCSGFLPRLNVLLSPLQVFVDKVKGDERCYDEEYCDDELNVEHALEWKPGGAQVKYNEV